MEREPAVDVDRLAGDIVHRREEQRQPAHVLGGLRAALRDQRQLVARP